MNSYIHIASDLIEKQVNKNNTFTLIKLENFINPKVYLEIYNNLYQEMQSKGMNFIAKLSNEKYNYWINSGDYSNILDIMKQKDLISNDRLTAYRNMKQNSGLSNATIFLMGTEAVEDQGGLEDFYTINPEIIEGYVGKKYSTLFTIVGMKLDEDQSKFIDKIYENIFKVVQKDLFKLSNFIDSICKDIDFYDLINEIFNNLYECWNIPNIRGILKELSKIKRTGKIDIIQKAYKFSNRVGISKFQTDKKLDKLEKDAKHYYEKNQKELLMEFSDKFPGYDNFDEVIEDLKKYIQGIDINVKDKLFQCDFNEINKVLNLKTEGKPPRTSTPKIYGDPFRAIFLPVLIELNELTIEEKSTIDKIDININKITLANTKSQGDEELKSKWKSMCRFLGGIEHLFNNFGVCNNDRDEIELNIYSEIVDSEKVYTFNYENTNTLIKSGILKSSSQAEQKSKIIIEYNIYSNESENAIDKYEYEWNIPETDIWIYLFNFINGKFEELIQQEKFLPIGISNKLDYAFEVKNEEEFIYSIKDLDVEYIDILDKYKNTFTTSYIKVEQIGKSFVRFINSLNEVGLFNSIYTTHENSMLALNYIKLYNDAIPCIISDLKDGINKEFINEFSKTLLVVNNSETKSKSITGAMMTPYHPVMLEKIIDRYTYLANGFGEVFKEICESDKEEFKSKVIINKFDRFDQLATITSGASMMIGPKNEFVSSKLTYGFYSLYGENNETYKTSSTKVDFEIEEDFSEIIQSNPISSHISKTIADYLNTYPSKIDGINVGFVNYDDYKLIITGLHEIISKTEKLDMKFKLNVYIYTDDYTCSGKNYIKYWLENKFTEDDKVTVRAFLKYIDIDSTSSIQDYVSKYIDEADIIFMSNILKVKEIEPEPIDSNHSDKKIENRYPSVYLPIPCSEERFRKVCISQNQFECELNYAQLITYVNNSNVRDEKYRAIKRVELTNKNENLIEALHEKGNWIVILDENIDTKILTLNPNKIIGFTTGNGYFGEINTAISTKESHLNDLKNFLMRRLKSKFNSWNAEQIQTAAQYCIEYAKYLDGSEILKAINPDDESINNYLAYMLTSAYENIFDEEYNDSFYIRKIISLDSHSHLFDNQLDLSKNKNINSRPDFIIIEIPKVNNSLDDSCINIKIKVIECKLANENDVHIIKAIDQVVEGYNRLKKIWNQDSNSVEKRFWFNQLYRILAYNNSFERLDDKNYREFIFNKLNSINGGNFDIEFENYIYTYWLDRNTDEICDEEHHYGDEKDIVIRKFGNKSIKKLLIPGYVEDEEFVEEDKSKLDDIVNNSNLLELNKQLEYTNIKRSVQDENSENIYKNNKLDNEFVDPNEWIEEFITIDKNEEELLIKNSIIDMLDKSDNQIIENEEESIKRKVQTLKNELEIRKIKIIPNDYIIGPDIVRIRVTLGTGIDFSQIEKHAENMKLWLGINERPYIFIADGFVNIDVVRSQRQMIRMGDILEKLNSTSKTYSNYNEKFYVLLGEDILGNPKIIDLSDSNSPHLLIAGQTGSGKSVLLNSMLASIMSIYKPDEVEMILVDPKQVELTIFEESPFTKNNHIATESHEAIQLLDELVNEMNRRYKLFRDNRVKNITDYNKKYPESKEKRILMVFDEYGAMIEESKDVKDKLEQAIKQLSQKARAAGIHMIICTQTPRADIITTTIRNNLTARIALKVADSTASSLIIDTKGAESLLGKGDMLVKTADTSSLIRTKSPFIDEMEVLDIVDYLNNKK